TAPWATPYAAAHATARRMIRSTTFIGLRSCRGACPVPSGRGPLTSLGTGPGRIFPCSEPCSGAACWLLTFSVPWAVGRSGGWAGGGGAGKTVGVRINAVATRWCYRDVIDVVEPLLRDMAGQGAGALDVIVVPKVERAADVVFVDRLLTMVEETVLHAAAPG